MIERFDATKQRGENEKRIFELKIFPDTIAAAAAGT